MSSNSASIELDLSTIQKLDSLATRWGITRQEAVAKAISNADHEPTPSSSKPKSHILKELQQRLNITPEKAAAWQADVQAARR